MRTVKEVSQLTGVSIRTLHHYDALGLLRPTATTASGYRLYDDTALARLQTILLFRELEFPLRDIKEIMDGPDFDQGKALEQQIELLTLKKEHLEDLIDLARAIKRMGVNYVSFEAFDTRKLEEYAAQAKASWGATPEYKEFEDKNRDRTLSESKELGNQLMMIVAEFGAMKTRAASDPTVQSQVKKLQGFITENYYTCTPEILAGLGEMYAGGGAMTENIDHCGGPGTAEFARAAIAVYCQNA